LRDNGQQSLRWNSLVKRVPKQICKQLCKQRLIGQKMLKSFPDMFLETDMQMFT